MHVSIDIDAPADQVWDILTDLPRYPEWNPLTPRVEGELKLGATLQLTADLGFRRTQPQRVTELEPYVLTWTGGIGKLVYGHRTQRLVVLGANRCRYTSDESMNGPLAGLTLWLLRGRLMGRFHEMAAALKHRAEQAV